ncbi:MAG: ATP-dependent Clp protease adaptor ClpS [Nitrospirae bacterium]|nr:ATP-dependent Clp protease adaptor ClpS [Nitrospirota bacterium]
MTPSARTVHLPVIHENQTTGVSTGEPHHVILYNDDHHAFDVVVRQVQKATGVSTDEAFAITFCAHASGRAVCYAGAHAACEHVADILREIALQVEVDRA